jgi:hypothetical protein
MRHEKAKKRALAPFLCLAAIALFPGCSDSPVDLEDDGRDPIERAPATWHLIVMPANPALEAGQSIQLRAYLLEQETGALRDAEEVRWETSDPKIAMVTAFGRVDTYDQGEVVITAILQDPPNQAAPGSEVAEATLSVR